jgi:hypothetical protein
MGYNFIVLNHSDLTPFVFSVGETWVKQFSFFAIQFLALLLAVFYFVAEVVDQTLKLTIVAG